jgi:hypothetical protein
MQQHACWLVRARALQRLCEARVRLPLPVAPVAPPPPVVHRHAQMLASLDIQPGDRCGARRSNLLLRRRCWPRWVRGCL